jgi:hypothetical protein
MNFAEHPLLFGPAGSERQATIHQFLQIQAHWRTAGGDYFGDRRCQERQLSQPRHVALAQSLPLRDRSKRSDLATGHLLEPGTRPCQGLEQCRVDPSGLVGVAN